MADIHLELDGLEKSFAGVRVTDSVTLGIERGELHALIGPNGAGKTTLISQIAGQLPPDAGRIRLDGHDITHLDVAGRVWHGLGRTFQISHIFKSQRVVDNVAMAIRASRTHCYRFWRPSRRSRRYYDEAHGLLEDVGLGGRDDELAATLAYGERRQLELAMALATGPSLLLLDEPMAGLGPGETQAMTAHLESLRGRYTMLLVEHDMDAVFRLADRISVLVRGVVIATGGADMIRTNPEVREAYLGNEAESDLSGLAFEEERAHA